MNAWTADAIEFATLDSILAAARSVIVAGNMSESKLQNN